MRRIRGESARPEIGRHGTDTATQEEDSQTGEVPRWLVMPTRPGHEDRCRHDSKDYIRAGYQCPDADENGHCNDIPF